MENKVKKTINAFSNLSADMVPLLAKRFGTPLYIYDESTIIEKCRSLLAMPNAFGLTVRYAMKANSNRSLLNIIHDKGLAIDASSLMEVRRAVSAGISCDKIILTSQEVQTGTNADALFQFMREGLIFNVCSLRQLSLILDFAADYSLDLSIRIHPGIGSGESASRNTGDHYSCFGVHLLDIPAAISMADERGVRFTHVHTHIGSGADPEIWRSNIDLELDLIRRFFPYAHTVSFGGGLKEKRMPDETAADINLLGDYAKSRIDDFFINTGRHLKMEIEPGTYVMANAGYILAEVIDKKSTGKDGFNFLVLNGGMELNARPLMYGSRHPFYVVSANGSLLYSDLMPDYIHDYQAIIMGCCCESGDSQCLDPAGFNTPRPLAEPNIGDFILIGGAGAYCASMSPSNYNSHPQAPEILLTENADFRLIRNRQSLNQLIENELAI